MTIGTQIIALLLMLGTSCADQMPVTARYVPADCPSFAGHASRIEDPVLPKPVPPPPEIEVEDDGRIDLNTASQKELESLPGVGPALAGRIIAYREKRRFERIAHLRRVRGIGPAKFAKVKELVTVQNSKP